MHSFNPRGMFLQRLPISKWNNYKIINFSKNKSVMGRIETADLMINTKIVSRHHCVFEFVDGRMYLDNAKKPDGSYRSTNGTYLNEEKIVQRTEVEENDLIGLGCNPTIESNEEKEDHIIFIAKMAEEINLLDSDDDPLAPKIEDSSVKVMDNAEISQLCDELWQIPTNFQEEVVIFLSSEEETEQDKTWKNKLTQNSKSSPPSSSQTKLEKNSEEIEISPIITTRECRVSVKKLSQEDLKEALKKSSLKRKQLESQSDSSESDNEQPRQSSELPSVKNHRNTAKKVLKRLSKVVDSESDDENILLKKNVNKKVSKRISTESKKTSSDAGSIKDCKIQRKKKLSKEKLKNSSETGEKFDEPTETNEKSRKSSTSKAKITKIVKQNENSSDVQKNRSKTQENLSKKVESSNKTIKTNSKASKSEEKIVKSSKLDEKVTKSSKSSKSTEKLNKTSTKLEKSKENLKLKNPAVNVKNKVSASDKKETSKKSDPDKAKTSKSHGNTSSHSEIPVIDVSSSSNNETILNNSEVSINNINSAKKLNNNSDDHECVQTARGTLKIRRKSISEAASNQYGFKLLQKEKQKLSANDEPVSKKPRLDPYDYDDSSDTSTPIPVLPKMKRRMTISHANEEFSRQLFRLPAPIIEPKPMPKRRGSTAAKPLPKRRQSTATAPPKQPTESTDMFAIAANKRGEEIRSTFNAPPRRNSVSGMTIEAAEKAKKARQEKLKAITESRIQTFQQQKEQAKKKIIERAATLPKVKNTVMTRGDFLTTLEPVKPVKKSVIPARSPAQRTPDNDPNIEQLLKQNQESISKFRSDHVQPAIGICNNWSFYERQESIPVMPPRRLTIEFDVDDIPPQPEDSQVVGPGGVGFYQEDFGGKKAEEDKKTTEEIMKRAGEVWDGAGGVMGTTRGMKTFGGLQTTFEESNKAGKSEEFHKKSKEPWNAARQVLQDFPQTTLNPIVLSSANRIRVVHQKPLKQMLKPALKSFSRSTEFRRSVSFKAVIEEVREYDIDDPVCENVVPQKAVAMVQPMNTPSGEEQVLAKILRWEPGYLIDRPEIFQTFPLKVEYESLSEFKKMINPIIEMELLTRMSNEYEKSQSVKENSWHKFMMTNPSYVRGRTRMELDRVQVFHQDAKERFNQGSLLVLKIMDTNCNREEEFFAYVVQENRQNFRTIVVEAIIDREKLKEYKIVQCRLVSYIRAELKSMIALVNLQETELVRKMLRPLTNLPNLSIENLEATTMDSNLSEMQTKIVRVVSREMVADKPNLLLIQGGPGTGKTKVIVASILNIFASARKLNKKFNVLICAMSNSCIDEIGTALYPHAAATGIKIVRAGILKPNSEAYPFSLNYLAEELKTRDNRNFLQLKHTVIGSADVVLSTINSSYEVYDTYKKKFDVCFVDEASQLNDAELVIPMHMKLEKMVLVGDENQLQPVVNSLTLQSKRFDVSLFSRICEIFKDKPIKPILQLTEQFRMRPEIFEFPNRMFYGNSMVNHPSVLSREPAYELKPYLMLNIASKQALTQDTSAYNLAEVDFVKFFVEVLLRWIPKELSIGLITPYVRQNNEISRKIQDSDRVSVYTIDSAQGLEKDVVLLALTRSNGVGFLNNPKRLNVALTRARRALYVIGNLSSLTHSELWKQIIADSKDRGVHHNVAVDVRENNLMKILRT